MRKLFALPGLVVLMLAVVVGAKTLLTPSRQLAVAAATPVKVDAAAAAARLGAAVRLKTIASRDDEDANAAEFIGPHALLQSSFPHAHAALKREVIGKYGLVYTWEGSDPKTAAIGLMAHSSMPPPEAGQSAIGMMSTALAKLEDRQMPLAVRGLSREMFETLAPEMSGANRVFLSNLWLFKPIIEQQLKKGASTNASLRTTTALTVFNAGQSDNVLPGRANATVNFRLLPGDTGDAVIDHVTQTIANPAIKIEKSPGMSEASKVAATDAAGFQLISKTLRQLHPNVIVAPGLMIGATDSRHFDGIADNVYKFSPVRAKPEDLKRFHGTNERISTDNYVELIQFYHQLISNSAPAP